MTAIERAEALLKVVERPEPECGCLPRYHRYRGLHDPDCPWQAWREARFAAGKRLGADQVDRLRGYIGAVKALEAEEEVEVASRRQDGNEMPDYTEALEARGKADELRRPAIADFERLFPETPASAD